MAEDAAQGRRAGARRAEVLRLIRSERVGIGVKALSDATGMHENTVRFHLRRLVEEGLVERRPVPAGTPGRPPLLFVAVEGPGHEGPGNYALIAQVLTQGLADHGLDAVEAATEFGRQWGRTRGAQVAPDLPAGGSTRGQALAAVLQVLEESGFEPDLPAATEDTEGAEGTAGAEDASRSVVQVHNCPFRLLAEEDLAVPCGVHRGIMEGVLEGAGVSDAVTELEPFVTPHLCLARMSFPG